MQTEQEKAPLALHPLVQEMLTTQRTTDAEGKSHELHSSIDASEAMFLERLIRENGFSRSIEVGCAMGTSALCICHALASMPDPRHVILDPFQTSYWHSIGLTNLRRTGYEFFELIEKRSEFALPALVEQGEKFDFAFIDGFHTFDHTMLDFFYMNRLVRVGGVIAIDDAQFPAIQRVVDYVSQYPCYEVISDVRLNDTPRLTKLGIAVAGAYAKVFGTYRADQLFAEPLVHPGRTTRLVSKMVALRKIAEDERPWDWYRTF